MESTIWKLLTIAVICAVSFAGPPSPDPQGGLTTISPAAISKDEVLSRWTEALGGRENLQNVRTIHLRGTIETGGRKGSYERWTGMRGELRTVARGVRTLEQACIVAVHGSRRSSWRLVPAVPVRVEDVGVQGGERGRPLFDRRRRAGDVLPGHCEVPALGVHLDVALAAPARR